MSSSLNNYLRLEIPRNKKIDEKQSSNQWTPRSVIVGFLSEIDYVRPHYPPRSGLEKELAQEIESWNIVNLDKHVPAMIAPSCAMAEMSYHRHDPELKALISLFTFFMIYIDDKSSRSDPVPFAAFQQRYSLSMSQMDPVLDQFATFLRKIWTHYDPFSANAIVASSLEFVNGCYLENVTHGMAVNPHAERYPYFLRSKTGVAQAYAFLIFPWAQHPTPTTFIQAIPSISYWIDITNDILSFYKEELACETANYVHLRAAVTHRKPLQVVRDLVEDALNAAAGIERTLQGDCLHAWLTFKLGYITFHISQERYRLSDLSLGLKSPSEGDKPIWRSILP